MAEKMVYVCDDCGKPAVETVQVATSRGKVDIDQCAQHVTALMAKGRPTRRGRPNSGAPKKPSAARKPVAE